MSKKIPILLSMLAVLADAFKTPRAITDIKINSRTAKRNKQPVRIIKWLAPKGEKNFHGQSIYQQYKPLHAPRHIAHR